MAIDMAALARAAEGDPNSKVSVRREWLAEVHSRLLAAEAYRRLGVIGDRLMNL